MTRRRLLPSVLALLACLLQSTTALAGDRSLDWAPVGQERLDGARGGFALPTGLTLAFGFDRQVMVNGQSVFTQRVHIPDIARMTPEQAQALADLQRDRVVQVGEGVRILPGANGGLVVQNALDGQQIQATTSLHATVNTLGLLQDINFAGALDAAARLGGLR